MNKRAEMWALTKRWLVDGGCPAIDGEMDEELLQDLITPEYGFDNRGRLQIERVEDIKARGKPSPDYATALALTFATNVRAQEPPPPPSTEPTVAMKLQQAYHGSETRSWKVR